MQVPNNYSAGCSLHSDVATQGILGGAHMGMRRYIARVLEVGAGILFECRTNTPRLRRGFAGGAIDCPLCGAVEGTVGYFVSECAVLEDVRELFGVTREDAL